MKKENHLDLENIQRSNNIMNVKRKIDYSQNSLEVRMYRWNLIFLEFHKNRAY